MTAAAAVPGILGRKAGMTQVFDAEGNSVSVTVVEAGPCTVVDVRTPERNGYAAVALGFGPVKAGRLPKPRAGQFGKLGPFRHVVEFRVEGEGGLPEAGAEVNVGDLLKAGDEVRVSGLTKGKGFQGPVKLHGFRGGGASHGSNFHRRQGSIGAATDPGRVFPGRKMAARMGGRRRTIRNLRIVEVDSAAGLLLIRGAVPGRKGVLLEIWKS